MSTGLPDLEAAIQQLVGMGFNDPLSIVDALHRQQGDEWIAQQAALYADDLIAEKARHALSATRRRAEVALRPGDPTAQVNLAISRYWVPGAGWKRASDLTPADLRARADWVRRMTMVLVAAETWLRDVASMIEAEGVETLGQLKGDLPPLPTAEEIAELPVGLPA